MADRAERAASAPLLGSPTAAVAAAGERAAIPLEELAARLGAACLAKHLTVAVAESCTGGLVAHSITEIAGASAYLEGGVVAYADATKVELLNVPRVAIDEHGAVSAQVAIAMAQGVRRRLSADLAVAVTGIAGPGGGTPAKPVGLTYVAVADAAGTEVRRYLWSGDRHTNKTASARAALLMLIERIGPPEP